jgi:hypothetical protein
MMKAKILLIGGAALAFAPSPAAAQAVPPGNGYINGTGYNHMNSGNAFGQPGQSCEDLIASGMGAHPGNAGTAPGGGSPFTGETSNAGQHYAGNAPQNARNTASVSQYDVACSHQQPQL